MSVLLKCGSFACQLNDNLLRASFGLKKIVKNFHEASCVSATDRLESEDKDIYEHALEFAKNELAPNMKNWDSKNIFPKEVLRHVGALGFGAIYCQEKFGGSHMNRLQASIIFEALSHGCPSTTAYISIHNMCAWMIDTYGSDGLREKWVPSLATMENFGSYCLTEPDSGSDASSLKTSIVKKGSEYVLNGTKSFISGAGESAVYLVMGRTGEGGPKGISCVLVEADRKGLSFGKKEEKVGWCTHPARQVFMEDVVVPTSNLLGVEGQGFNIAMHGLNGGRINVASVSVGAAAAALEAATKHLTVRKQFGRSLKDFQPYIMSHRLQYLQFKLAEMASSVVSSRLMVRHAARSLDLKTPNLVSLAAMAKLFSTEQCSKVILAVEMILHVCDQAIQMFGGYGYLKEYPVQQYYRDIRLHHIIEGTNEMMRMLIARDLLK
ncbi:hypothetical protein HELRODRAFT_193037 [Helobdella robusta]|uniref:Acyl-CoA dehydrogenase/oxidase C-terminal domain-containing protein n=1 Tax=Helobdella robusta TaxID=6412 RepID=T1FUJ9_HELRO|nr:hypothetical protein HELRODRAFT_193037 [Helobdella robusta]ESN98303.1 hypothetical protein HELRODRAFT_193037 [Helobdella robusta]